MAGLLLGFVLVMQAAGFELVRDSGAPSHSHVSFFVPLLAAAIAAATAVFWHPEERPMWAALAAGLALGAAAESAFPHTHGESQGVPAGAAIAYGIFCAVSGATVLAASGDFRLRRSLAQGLGVCAFGLATLWTWLFLIPAGSDGSAGDTVRSALDLLLALAALAALCNHGWPTTTRFALLAGGFGLIALADSLEVSEAVKQETFGPLLDALPYAAAALVAAVACSGIRPESNRARSGRLVVIVSLLAVTAAVVALVYDHYARLDSAVILLAGMTLLAAGAQMIVAQRGWRDARARARVAEATGAGELMGLDAVLTVGPDGRVVACNERACRIFRRGEIEIVGKPVGNLLGGAGARPFAELIAEPESLPLATELDAYDTHGVGFPVEVAVGAVKSAASVRTVVVRDISERRRREEENRRLAAIIRSSDDAVLTKDLNGVVTGWNQGAERLYGYSAGEAIGRHVGDLIIPLDRHGEEGRILREVAAGETVSFETERITKSGEWIDVSLRGFPIRGLSGEVTAICTVGHDVSDRRRRERTEQRDSEALLWRKRLRQALGNGDLVFHGQPILDLASGRVDHHELLVRMQLNGKLIPPGAFLPFAEESELIRDLDLWAVERGIGIGGELPVAINLSARSLGSRGLLTAIEKRLGAGAVAPADLTFEITETAAAENMPGARELVGELTRMGCGVALDDFGTGYGSFTYLRHLPVTQLKIDTEFISGIANDAADRRVVESMVDVAHNFEMTTVAEGVEDQATLDRLGEMGVDQVQGYHVGRPQPLELGTEASDG
jgi:PAS domain S-box-containing protein